MVCVRLPGHYTPIMQTRCAHATNTLRELGTRVLCGDALYCEAPPRRISRSIHLRSSYRDRDRDRDRDRYRHRYRHRYRYRWWYRRSQGDRGSRAHRTRPARLA